MVNDNNKKISFKKEDLNLDEFFKMELETNTAIRDIIKNRAEHIEAYAAAYFKLTNLDPREVELVEEQMPEGRYGFTWHFRKKQNIPSPYTINNIEYLFTLVDNYYKIRTQKWPTAEQAMLWATTEIGEAVDELMKLEGGWKRNNPAKQIPFNKDEFVEELGDVIFMLIVASMAVGSEKNPVTAMVDKIERKIAEHIHTEKGE